MQEALEQEQRAQEMPHLRTQKTSVLSDPSNNILMSDCLQMLNNRSNLLSKGTGGTASPTASREDIGPSRNLESKTPLVNVPTFNDLENQQFANENNGVFTHRYSTNYQSIFQKRNDVMPNALQEQQGNPFGPSRSHQRTISGGSSQVNPVRSNQSKRAQPSQSRDNQAKERKYKQQLPTTRARNLATMDDVYLGERQRSTGKVRKQLSSHKSPTKSPTPSKPVPAASVAVVTEQSTLTKHLNMVSSDTIQEKHQAQGKGRRYSNSIVTKYNNEDLPDFKKINRCPYPEAKQKINVYQAGSVLPKPQTSAAKHSSQALHRARIPSIAQQFKLTQEQSRFNLKTREEQVTKLSIDRADNAKFDGSLDGDMSQGGITSNLARIANQMHKNALATAQLPKVPVVPGKLNSNFLAQAEILRVKPDGFRRVSIETDPEFAHCVPMTATNVTNCISPEETIVERPRFTAMDDDEDLPEAADQTDDGHSMRGMTPSPSKMSRDLLPKQRKIPKPGLQINGPVIASKQESSRPLPLVDMVTKDSVLTPSIKKALRDRANFYRRKLTFYENLGVLAVSLTSEEMGYKIAEARNDLKSSVNTQNSLLANFGRDNGPQLPDKLRRAADSQGSTESKRTSRKGSNEKTLIPINVTKRLDVVHRERPAEQRNNRFHHNESALSELADFSALAMTKRTSQSPSARPFDEAGDKGRHMSIQFKTARESTHGVDAESILPANLRASIRDLQERKKASRSSFSQLLLAWQNTTADQSVGKLAKPIGQPDARGNIVLTQQALQPADSGAVLSTQLSQYAKELRQRAHNLTPPKEKPWAPSGYDPEERLPRKRTLRLPNRIKLGNKLKKDSPSPVEAANRLNLRINRVSPPSRTMAAFEPVQTFRHQRAESQKPRLTPIKKRPTAGQEPSCIDKEKATKLVMLAKLIKNL